MRIAYFAPFYPSRSDWESNFTPGMFMGGGETYALSLAEGVAARGHEVTVISHRIGKQPVHEFARGAQVRRYPGIAILGDIADPWSILMLLTELQRLRADVVHCHHYMHFSSFIGTLIGMRRHFPVVITHHGMRSMGRRYLRAKQSLLGKFVLSRATAIAVGNLYDWPWLQRLGASEDRRHVIPHGIDVDRFCPQEKTSEFTILFVGRLEKHKGVPDLVQAAAILRRQGYLFRLVIVGRGPERDGIEQQIVASGLTGCVELPGFVEDQQLRGLMARAHVLVFPSTFGERYTEVFGLVVAEAMASGTPAIATPNGGVQDLVLDGQTGFLVPQHSPESIAEKLEVLCRDRAQLAQLSSNALCHVRERFTLDRMIEEHLSLYRSLCG